MANNTQEEKKSIHEHSNYDQRVTTESRSHEQETNDHGHDPDLLEFNKNLAEIAGNNKEVEAKIVEVQQMIHKGLHTEKINQDAIRILLELNKSILDNSDKRYKENFKIVMRMRNSKKSLYHHYGARYVEHTRLKTTNEALLKRYVVGEQKVNQDQSRAQGQVHEEKQSSDQSQVQGQVHEEKQSSDQSQVQGQVQEEKQSSDQSQVKGQVQEENQSNNQDQDQVDSDLKDSDQVPSQVGNIIPQPIDVVPDLIQNPVLVQDQHQQQNQSPSQNHNYPMDQDLDHCEGQGQNQAVSSANPNQLPEVWMHADCTGLSHSIR